MFHATHVGGPYQPNVDCYRESKYPRVVPRPDLDIHPSGCVGGASHSGSWELSPLKGDLYNYFLQNAKVDDIFGMMPISMHRWFRHASVHINCPVAGVEIQLVKVPLLVSPTAADTPTCMQESHGFCCETNNWVGVADEANAEALGPPISFDDAWKASQEPLSTDRDPAAFAFGYVPDDIELNLKTWMLGFKVIALPEDGLCDVCSKTDVGFAVHVVYDDDCYRMALEDGGELTGWEITPLR